MSDNRHPGINMHKLPVGGGFIGLVFATGTAVIFILGFPTLWYFVAFSAGLGIAIAVIIRFMHQRTSDRNKPLSILTAEAQQNRQRRQRQKWHKTFQTMPEPSRP
jgi:membrane protein implicated in regulation of membrane protease activity